MLQHQSRPLEQRPAMTHIQVPLHLFDLCRFRLFRVNRLLIVTCYQILLWAERVRGFGIRAKEDILKKNKNKKNPKTLKRGIWPKYHQYNNRKMLKISPDNPSGSPSDVTTFHLSDADENICSYSSLKSLLLLKWKKKRLRTSSNTFQWLFNVTLFTLTLIL